MNFKRGKPKNARAGCLMCKSNKMNGYSKDTWKAFCHHSFSNLRKAFFAKKDLKAFLRRKF